MASTARSLRAVVVPEWLVEVVRPRRAPVPTVAVGLAGTRPPPLVIDVVSRLADAIRD